MNQPAAQAGAWRWTVPMVGGAAFILYLLTAAREPQFGDGLELVAAAAVGGVPHPPGYPLMMLLLSPFANGVGAYWRCTMLCAVLAVLTAMAVAALAKQILSDHASTGTASESFLMKWVPLAAGLAAACSVSLWSAATEVEVYGLNAALVSAALLALVPGERVSAKRLFLGALCVGLAATNHLTSLAVAPVLAWRALERFKKTGDTGAPISGAWIGVGAALVGLLIGLVPIAALPLRAAHNAPINWGAADTREGFEWMISGGDYKRGQLMQKIPGVPFTFGTWVDFGLRRANMIVKGFGAEWTGGLFEVEVRGTLAAVFASALGAVAWTTVLAGGFALWKRRRALVLMLAIPASAQLAFLFVYNIVDIRDYLLGVWVCLAPLAAMGAFALLRKGAAMLAYDADTRRARRLAIVLALPVLLGIGANLGTAGKAGNRLARAWIDRTFSALPEDAILLTHSDYDTYGAWYGQLVEGSRRDLLIVPGNFLRNSWIRRMLPVDEPDSRGRQIFPEPGDVFVQRFTPADHAKMLFRAVIDPNADRVHVYGTALPPEWGDVMFAAIYSIQAPRTRAALLSDDEVGFMAEAYPTVAPPLLIEFLSSRNGAARP